jgi:hypothetical protein
MNDLETYFNNNIGRLVHKWHHYFEIYDRHFSRFRGKDIVILEIGVSQGGSLQMWKNYFGPKAAIYGIDIEPRCKSFEEDGIKIFIGSQSDRNFLREVKKSIPKVDILIDDGGHSMKQQIVSFEELFSHIKQDGVYLCEDCHTSYWWEYGGGYKRRGTFIEYSKNWIDYINAFHSKTNRLKVNEFTLNVKSLHYYDSIVVVEKSKITEPTVSKTGNAGFENTQYHSSLKKRMASRAKSAARKLFGFLGLPYHIE